MKQMKSVIAVSVFAVLLLGLALIQPAFAEGDYPKKPITVVVCYSPGGDADLTARLWADFAEKKLGQPVIVVNKTGGGGVAGTTFAANAKADGYTLYFAQAGATIIAPQTAKTSYDVNSFVYISRVMIGNCGLVVNAESPWNSLEDFVKDAKAKPGQLIFASPGAATWLTLAMQHWEMSADVQLKQVEHQGSAPAVTSVLGNHADMSFLFPQSYAPQVKAGKLRVLALGEASPVYPGVPSFNELGYPGEFFGWGGVAAPKGVPAEVVEKVAAVTKSLMDDPAFVKALENIHATPSYLGPVEWTEAINRQHEDLAKVIDKLGIRAN